MTTCQDMLDKLVRVPMEFTMTNAMELTADEASQQQRLQLAQGLRSDDSTLPEYSFRSVFQYGKPPGPIRLYDTGAFYRGIKLDVREDIYILESSDSKSTMLQNKYGPDILGLGSNAMREYIITLNPVFIRELKRYLE